MNGTWSGTKREQIVEENNQLEDEFGNVKVEAIEGEASRRRYKFHFYAFYDQLNWECFTIERNLVCQ